MTATRGATFLFFTLPPSERKRPVLNHLTAVSMASEQSDDARLVEMLLHDDVWRALHLAEAQGGEANQTAARRHASYLEATVYPTLVPALAELLERVQLVTEKGAAMVPHSTAVAPASSHPVGAAGPTVWLAQYLMRHNSSAVGTAPCRPGQHPYSVLYRASSAAAPGQQP